MEIPKKNAANSRSTHDPNIFLVGLCHLFSPLPLSSVFVPLSKINKNSIYYVSGLKLKSII